MTMPDSRVERLATYIYSQGNFHDLDDARSCARDSIRYDEAAGLLVLDLDDRATIERIAEAIDPAGFIPDQLLRKGCESVRASFKDEAMRLANAVAQSLRDRT